MEKFSLEKYLENPSRKVVTRDGREVDIYYSPTSRVPLIGRTSDNEVHQYTEDGFQYDRINEAKNDLFFAEEEFTEFEKALSDIIGFWQQGDYVSKDIKTDAKTLLYLARKEVLESLPKWKKSTKILSENPYLAFYPSDDHRNLCVNGFEINIHELFETLPKEE